MELSKPFRGNYPTTQGFGKAQSGLRYSYHYGIDYGVPDKTPLLSSFDGVVEKAVNSFVPMVGYGRHVVVRSENMSSVWRILYGHCSQILVKVGDKVKRGDILALSGRTGYVVSLGGGGYHLHFALSRDGSFVDPLPFFPAPVSVPVVSLDPPVLDVPLPYVVPSGLSGEYKDYVVKRGDTLWGISLRFYGSGVFWDFLFHENPIIGKNPNILKVGAVLKLAKVKK